ncbi:MAG: DNA repair exonuclease [Hyphomonadaceae bacterium]|nr:DNA repair exonuclease [Hyphomonadaceae bacterium]
MRGFHSDIHRFTYVFEVEHKNLDSDRSEVTFSHRYLGNEDVLGQLGGLQTLTRFLHTSDWQLGKPFGRATAETRAALQDARLDMINTIAATARSSGAGLVLVAGDVFDSSEPGDRVFRQALSRMKASDDVKWVLLPGNHDPARADGLWSRLRSEAPVNVVACVEPQVVNLEDDLAILPAPLQFKRTSEDPTAWFDGAVTEPGAARIGLAHGSVVEFGSDGPNNLIASDRAARAGLQYLALGDWHGCKEVNSRTYYSGTPEPDDFGRDATGRVLIIEPRGANSPPALREVVVEKYSWREAEWQISSPEQLERHIGEAFPPDQRPRIVARMTLSGSVTLADRVAILSRLDDELAHELRWLDTRIEHLHGRATDDDLSNIDSQGVLRTAAERLRSMAAEPSKAGLIAQTALERLYVEIQRAQRAES